MRIFGGTGLPGCGGVMTTTGVTQGRMHMALGGQARIGPMPVQRPFACCPARIIGHIRCTPVRRPRWTVCWAEETVVPAPVEARA